ncbi:FHA domain-containing protein [Asanoa ishikariensis]|uniref:FHA domain-containing protein n=1 Tax=Asanoa ishikariensis TaxID=137265 RepID=UPI001950A65F|nr:FHA domain-containing protein [Asanoa ishikariensis]
MVAGFPAKQVRSFGAYLEDRSLPDGKDGGNAPKWIAVDFGRRQFPLRVGEVLTVGRARSCDLQLPDDDHLSRRACSLRVLDDCVLIRNDSTRKPVVVRPPAGEDRVVEPGAATTSLPFPRFALVLTGRTGTVVTVTVDASRLAPNSPPVTPRQSLDRATALEPIELSAAQRRILVALCAPVLTESGPRAVPATYAQVGAKLGLQPQYVRNVVKTLREKLWGHGVHGLTPDDSDAAHDDFRWTLVRWAVRSGWVTAVDVAGGDDAT